MTQQIATAVMGSSAISRPQLESLDGVGLQSKEENDWPQVLHNAFGWWRTGTSTLDFKLFVDGGNAVFYCNQGDPYDFGDTGACELCVVPTVVNSPSPSVPKATNRFVGDLRYWDEGFYVPPGAMLPGSILTVKIRGNVRNNTGGARTVYVVLDPDSNVRFHGITGLLLDGTWTADAALGRLDYDNGGAPSSMSLTTGQPIEVWDADTTGLSLTTRYYAKALDTLPTPTVDGFNDAIELYTDYDFTGTKVALTAGTPVLATASNLFGQVSNVGDTITLVAHGLAVGDVVQAYDKGAGVPTGVTEHVNVTVATVPSADTLTLTGLTLSSDVSGWGLRRRPIGSKYAIVLPLDIPASIANRTGYELDVQASPDVGNQNTSADTDAVTWTAALRIGSLADPADAAGTATVMAVVNKSDGAINAYDWANCDVLQYEVDPVGTLAAGMFMLGSTSGATGIILEHNALLREVRYIPVSLRQRFHFGETITCYVPVGGNNGLVTNMDLQTSVFTMPSHGLVDDDAVTVYPHPNSMLPAPLVAGTTYYADELSSTTFALHTAAPVSAGNKVTLTARGSVTLVRTGGTASFVARTRLAGTGLLMGLRFASEGPMAAVASALEFNVHSVVVTLDRIRSRSV